MAAARRRGPLVPLALITAFAAAGTLFAPTAAAAATTPTVRLLTATDRIKVVRERHDYVDVDPGAFVTPVGGAFELRVSRPDYDTPIAVDQVDAGTGTTLRTIPNDMLQGWYGLRRFAEIEVLDRADDPVMHQVVSFCPNSYLPERLSDDGPLTPTYPYMCGGYSPFIMGQVWGIDQGWAASLVGDPWGGGGLFWRANRHLYTISIEIKPEWIDVLGIDPSQAYATVHVKVVDKVTSPAASRQKPSASPSSKRYAATPIDTSPDPATLPDIVATPAWGLQAYGRRGNDYLTFFATEWNAGPGEMVIDGFRNDDPKPTMDAYQYFLQDGDPVGRAPIGQLVYDLDHQHWHFEQFAQYSLLDADMNKVMVSDKNSWCLAPSDPMDLLVPNADWRAQPQDLSSSCGYRQTGALWIREVLPVGWGDTYAQFQNFGAFDISDLPNGWYYLRTQVNPLGAIYEGTSGNDIADRLIRLRGTPGHRRVVVPPWHGIDTEHGCPFCPF